MLRSEAKRAAILWGAFLLVLCLAPLGQSQVDPGVQDSMIIGNFDGTPILAGLNTQITVPVYLRTDDSVIFIHFPIATDNDYIVTRNGGSFFPPLSLWDDVSFLNPDTASPISGYTSQSILGFAFLIDPRDPQNFLYTNNQWVHIADYRMTTTSDFSVLGDTTLLVEGDNLANGDLYMGLSDAITLVRPAVIWGQIYFPPNNPPVYLSPDSGTVPVNEQFGACFTVTATDSDADSMVLTVSFGPTDYTLVELQDMPGQISYQFCWVPGPGEAGTYPLTFIVNDGNGGVVERNLTLVVTPAGLTIGNMVTLPGTNISLPVDLNNEGSSSAVGGFEILINYPPEALTLNGVTRTGRIGSFEFFRVNYDDSGPGTARIVGVADIRNGLISPPLQPGTGPIFFLEMSVSSDENLIGVDLPITFINLDESDNTLSDSTGYLLIHPQLTNGTVSVIGPDDFQVGDINLNGVPFEVGDAVLFVNHLTNPALFPFNSVQREASDVNSDGIPETVADLVYLINIVAGIIPEPGPGKLEPLDGDVIVAAVSDGDRMIFSANSPHDLGAVLIRVAHLPGVTLKPVSDGDFTIAYSDDGSVLSILAYMPQGGGVPAGRTVLFSIVASREDLIICETQASDDIGHLLESVFRFEAPLPESYTMAQNYPNPFNANTRISFGLPQESDVRLDVYAITGARVATLLDGRYQAGWYDINWNGADASGKALASGVYFYKLNAGGEVISMKMTLLK